MAAVVVTVGMGRWPFDRLVRAAGELCAEHDVFVQTGTSTIEPPCEHTSWAPPEELRRRMLDADVVITHAGNTVRWLQRHGRVPVAVAREHARGEMGNDHQVAYLRREQAAGRVVAVWQVDELADVVRRHPQLAAALESRPVPSVADPERLRDQLDALCAADAANGPFAGHPVRRYDFAWRRLAGRTGRHLDLGCNTGELLQGLAATSALDVVGVDANDEVLASAARRGLPVLRTDRWARLPFPDGTFDSASALDVLEHVPDEAAALRELHRVLRPGGLLVVSVPAAHVFSVLDPDNAKLRVPRLHAAVYRARFGRRRYRERFVELEDGYRGDLAVERHDHTNFAAADLLALVRDNGFEPIERSGSNLFWRLWHPVSLLGGGAPQRLADRLTLRDGRTFSSANLFLVAEAA